MGRTSRGNQLWLLPIGQAAQWLAETSASAEPAHAAALAAIFQARVALDTSKSQEAAAQSLVSATQTLVTTTNRLVRATLVVAAVTAIAAVAAVWAVISGR